MKRITLLALSAILSICAIAQPKLVGHRGSGYGLENSVESFKKGVDLGYHYLETDVKMTKDRRFVCSHDDDLTRLGGTKTIASSTLEELQSETLSQTRSGVAYTGIICSLEEYLQIIKDAGIGAVIELKWTTGINSNDQSNIPALINAIDAMGMRKDVIILTSMKPCLEYIRKNYPDITLQFLTGQYWESHFDWCVEWNIDVDIQSGYFDKSTVKKYHAKGLKVNMWTTNDEAGYKNYGNMGCDFITTDRIDGHNLPELDPSVTFPPNLTDYPETEDARIKGRYDIADTHATPLKKAEGLSICNAMHVSDGWIALYNDNSGTSSLYLYKGSEEPKKMKSPEENIINIAVTAEGKLFGIASAGNENSSIKTYIWDTPESTPRLLWTAPSLSGYTGESMTVSGLENSLKTFIANKSGSAPSLSIYESAGNNITSSAYAPLKESFADATLTISPFNRNNVVFSGTESTPAEYTFDTGETPVLKEYANIPLTTRGLSYFRYGSKPYAVFPHISTDRKLTIEVYDVTSGYTDMIQVCAPVEICTLPESRTYVATSADIADDNAINLHIFVDGTVITDVILNKQTETPAPVDLELELERKWILSNTTGNHPGNIDGTNAQQGTAVNGLFYIHNCVDKLIYIFDQTGCIGSIPGGSGFGCTRDDAGNIIIRDDKLTGNTHNFIIYPAGARPESYGTPVKLNATVPFAGQTNFISASGDVLGDGGIIYLYPNKQTAVNLIHIEGGEITNVRAAQDLKAAGTTAGYVIPVGNDSENWLYQIRTSGIYRNSGGVNSDVLTTRTTTTAPGRNSTGGAAYIVEGGNNILIHNSGSNYKGGFTVRDLTLNKVITSVTPIGELGYETGGNYSTFNWLIAERNGYADYTIYQYCPSNGMAVYSLRNPKGGAVDSISADNIGSRTLSYTLNGTSITASESGLSLIDMSGRTIITSSTDTIDTTGLSDGIYILTSRSGRSAKIAL